MRGYYNDQCRNVGHIQEEPPVTNLNTVLTLTLTFPWGLILNHAEMSWVQSVLGLKCFDTYGIGRGY